MPRPGVRTSGSHPQSTSKPLLEPRPFMVVVVVSKSTWERQCPRPEAQLATIAVRDRSSHLRGLMVVLRQASLEYDDYPVEPEWHQRLKNTLANRYQEYGKAMTIHRNRKEDTDTTVISKSRGSLGPE